MNDHAAHGGLRAQFREFEKSKLPRCTVEKEKEGKKLHFPIVSNQAQITHVEIVTVHPRKAGEKLKQPWTGFATPAT